MAFLKSLVREFQVFDYFCCLLFYYFSYFLLLPFHSFCIFFDIVSLWEKPTYFSYSDNHCAKRKQTVKFLYTDLIKKERTWKQKIVSVTQIKLFLNCRWPGAVICTRTGGCLLFKIFLYTQDQSSNHSLESYVPKEVPGKLCGCLWSSSYTQTGQLLTWSNLSKSSLFTLMLHCSHRVIGKEKLKLLKTKAK